MWIRIGSELLEAGEKNWDALSKLMIRITKLSFPEETVHLLITSSDPKTKTHKLTGLINSAGVWVSIPVEVLMAIVEIDTKNQGCDKPPQGLSFQTVKQMFPDCPLV